jgi:iron complex outermembrane receptor protein
MPRYFARASRVFAWVSLLIPAMAFAHPHGSEVQAAERVVYQDTVTVVATKVGSRLARLATSATVLSPAEIQLGTSRTLYGALASVPGVHLFDQSGSESQGSVEARGFASQGTSSHMLVLIDEVPINEFESDRVDWNLLAQSQVERIEFLRGPASFLYGNESMAGVVNLVTRVPNLGTTGWVEGRGGDFGRAGGAGGVSWRDEKTTASLSGEFSALDGYRDHSERHDGGGYGVVRTALTSKLALVARALLQRAEQDIPGPLPNPTWQDDPKVAGTPLDDRDATTFTGGLELDAQATDELGFVGFVSTDVRNEDATETIVPTGTLNRSSDITAIRGEVRAHWQPKNLPLPHLLVGAEIENGTLESRYSDPSSGGVQVGAGDVERRSGAVYALAVARLHERLELTAGLRGDWLRSSLDVPDDGSPRGPNDDLRAWSPTVGLNWALPNSGNAYVSYAHAFKAPTLEQLYDQRPYDLDGPGGFPPITITNHALTPQRGEHWDLGARTPLGPKVTLDGALYYARSRNEIGFDLANFRYSSIDKSTHAGVEAGLATQLSSWALGRLSYAGTSATFDGGPHDGKQINTVPEHQIFASAVMRHPWNGSVTVELTYVMDQWIDEDNVYRLPDYATTDLGLTQSIGGLEVFGAVRNLFDRRYATLGFVTLDQFGADLPLYFPAMARSVQLGVRYPGSRSEVSRPADD